MRLFPFFSTPFTVFKQLPVIKGSFLLFSRFVCCVMIAVPLAATLFTAMVKSERSATVNPMVEFSHVNNGLNMYGTLKTNGSSSTEMQSSTLEENCMCKLEFTAPCAVNETNPYLALSFVGGGPVQLWISQSCVHGCLQAFSLQTTSQGIFSNSSVPGGGYSSLNGIRVLSLLWIICGHSAQFPVINNLGMRGHREPARNFLFFSQILSLTLPYFCCR